MNNFLSFLDIKIIRKNNYSRPQSIASLYSLMFLPTLRVLYLARAELFHQAIENFKKIFRQNRYPVNFANFCIKKYLDNLYVKEEVFLLASKRQLTFVLPFFGKKSL